MKVNVVTLFKIIDIE